MLPHREKESPKLWDGPGRLGPPYRVGSLRHMQADSSGRLFGFSKETYSKTTGHAERGRNRK